MRRSSWPPSTCRRGAPISPRRSAASLRASSRSSRRRGSPASTCSKTSRLAIDIVEDSEGRNLHVLRLVELKHWARGLDIPADRMTYTCSKRRTPPRPSSIMRGTTRSITSSSAPAARRPSAAISAAVREGRRRGAVLGDRGAPAGRASRRPSRERRPRTARLCLSASFRPQSRLPWPGVRISPLAAAAAIPRRRSLRPRPHLDRALRPGPGHDRPRHRADARRPGRGGAGPRRARRRRAGRAELSCAPPARSSARALSPDRHGAGRRAPRRRRRAPRDGGDLRRLRCRRRLQRGASRRLPRRLRRAATSSTFPTASPRATGRTSRPSLPSGEGRRRYSSRSIAAPRATSPSRRRAGSGSIRSSSTITRRRTCFPTSSPWSIRTARTTFPATACSAPRASSSSLLVALNRVLRRRGFFAGREEPDLLAGIDLVALATVADVVPLDRAQPRFRAAGPRRNARTPPSRARGPVRRRRAEDGAGMLASRLSRRPAHQCRRTDRRCGPRMRGCS